MFRTPFPLWDGWFYEALTFSMSTCRTPGRWAVNQRWPPRDEWVVMETVVLCAVMRKQAQVMRRVGHLSRERGYEIAHPSCISSSHHQLSVDIRLSGLIKFREDPGVEMQLTQVIFCSLGWISPESAVLITGQRSRPRWNLPCVMQLTQVIFCSLERNASWVHRASQKLQFSQLLFWVIRGATIWVMSSRLDSQSWCHPQNAELIEFYIILSHCSRIMTMKIQLCRNVQHINKMSQFHKSSVCLLSQNTAAHYEPAGKPAICRPYTISQGSAKMTSIMCFS